MITKNKTLSTSFVDKIVTDDVNIIKADDFIAHTPLHTTVRKDINEITTQQCTSIMEFKKYHDLTLEELEKESIKITSSVLIQQKLYAKVKEMMREKYNTTPDTETVKTTNEIRVCLITYIL